MKTEQTTTIGAKRFSEFFKVSYCPMKYIITGSLFLKFWIFLSKFWRILIVIGLLFCLKRLALFKFSFICFTVLTQNEPKCSYPFYKYVIWRPLIRHLVGNILFKTVSYRLYYNCGETVQLFDGLFSIHLSDAIGNLYEYHIIVIIVMKW